MATMVYRPADGCVIVIRLNPHPVVTSHKPTRASLDRAIRLILAGPHWRHGGAIGTLPPTD